MTPNESVQNLIAAFDAVKAALVAKDGRIAELEAGVLSPETLAAVAERIAPAAPTGPAQPQK